MNISPKTVRAKLGLLVALSTLVAVVVMPLLWHQMHHQLIDEVDDRSENAQRSFQAEVDDDFAAITIAAKVIATAPSTATALASSDTKALNGRAALFLSVYPEVDIMIADATGKVVTQQGCSAPPAKLQEITSEPLTKAFHGVLVKGCEIHDGQAPAAIAVWEPVAGGGTVVVLQPLDQTYVDDASEKLGVEIALRGPGPTVATKAFPIDALSEPLTADGHSVTIEKGTTAWALASFAAGATGAAFPPAVFALDVSDITDIVRRNRNWAFLLLLGVAMLSAWAGWSVASVMSRALSRVTRALKKLEEHEYVPVDALRTGDELEDLATGFNHMIEALQKAEDLRAKFGKYMTETLIQHLEKNEVALGGASLEVTILFTDIRSFTTISEKMDAQSLVALLNEYFTEMVGIVMDEQGIVDKYIGDAIMAVFGAPVAKPDDALRAVRAAVKMRIALAKLNERLGTRGIAPLRTGIGIHTGEVVAGNIGSDRRLEYTVIGDAVNLASRLESNTKDLGVNVLVSEDTWGRVEGQVIGRQVKEITVKGRGQPVMTYEVTGLKATASSPEMSEVPDRHRLGLDT